MRDRGLEGSREGKNLRPFERGNSIVWGVRGLSRGSEVILHCVLVVYRYLRLYIKIYIRWTVYCIDIV